MHQHEQCEKFPYLGKIEGQHASLGKIVNSLTFATCTCSIPTWKVCILTGIQCSCAHCTEGFWGLPIAFCWLMPHWWMEVPWGEKCCITGKGVYQLCAPLGSQGPENLVPQSGRQTPGKTLSASDRKPPGELFISSLFLCLVCNVGSQQTAKIIQVHCHHQIYHKLEISALRYL